jgi:hypothetical protein
VAAVVAHAADAVDRLREEGWAKAVSWTNALDLAAPTPAEPSPDGA